MKSSHGAFMLIFLNLICAKTTASDGLDGNWTVHSVAWPPNDALRNLAMGRMLFYPPNSTKAFIPAAFIPSVPPAASFSMTNCTITTLCGTVSAYAFMDAISPGTPTVSSLADGRAVRQILIVAYSSVVDGVSIRLSHVTLQCDQDTDASFTAATAVTADSPTFLSAVRALSLLGLNSRIMVEGPVRVSNETGWPLWPQAGIMMGDGTSLSVGSETGRGVIDFDMNADRIILPYAIMQPPGHLFINNLKLVNLCTTYVPLVGAYKFYLSMYTFGFEHSWNMSGPQVVYNHDSLLLVPRFEMETMAYWMVLFNSTFAAIGRYSNVIRVYFPGIPARGYQPDSNTVVLQSFNRNIISYTNVTLYASDAVLPEALKQASLQPAVMCSKGAVMNSSAQGYIGILPSQPLPADLEAKLRPLQPYYPITDASLLATMLPTVVAYVTEPTIRQYPAANVSIYLPPLLLQFVNVSFSLLPGSQSASFTRDVLWLGPSVPSTTISEGSPTSVILDLARTQGTLGLGGIDSALYMQRLTLINLLVASELGTYSGFRTFPTALPLWAIQFTRHAAGLNRVILDSMTIVLPLASFACLHALAVVGGPAALSPARTSNPGWASLHDESLDGLSVFNVSRFGAAAIAVTSYTGYGVSGTNILFRPESVFASDQPFISTAAPLSAAGLQVEEAPAVSAVFASPNDEGSSWKLIVGVTVGVGGAMVLTAIIAVMMVVARKRPAAAKDKRAEDASGSSDNGGNLEAMKQGKTCGSSLDSELESSPAVSTFISSMRTPSWDPMLEVRLASEQLGCSSPEQQCERLALNEVIAEGASGTVYRGRWRNMDVAVKTVVFSQDSGQRGGQQAVSEAALSTSLVHPNVVATYSFNMKPIRAALPKKEEALQIEGGDQDWKLYLIQELCDANVADALVVSLWHDRGTARPHLNLILCTLEDIARGVAYIHSKNIIHGDLKPENIMLKYDSSSPTGMLSKITDFGLSAALGPDTSHVSAFVNGTPFYSAPEIALTGRVTQASDAYSYGVIMMELYKGITPWIKLPDGRPVANPTFAQLPPDCPAAFLNLAHHCLRADPDQRPSFAHIVASVEAMHRCLMQRGSLQLLEQDAA